MRKSFLITAALAMAAAVAACDEGDIQPDTVAVDSTGRTATLTGEVSKTGEWPAGYSVALAGFADAGEYALVSKTVDASQLENDGQVTIASVPAEVTTMELCVIDRLRRRVATFVSVPCAGSARVRVEARGVDAGPMAALQTEVFNTTCAACHGASNHAAASLSLLAGESRSRLAGVASTVEPGATRVVPGDADGSLLWQILSTQHSASWRYDHSVEVVSQTRLGLVRAWIEAGAPE